MIQTEKNTKLQHQNEIKDTSIPKTSEMFIKVPKADSAKKGNKTNLKKKRGIK